MTFRLVIGRICALVKVYQILVIQPIWMPALVKHRKQVSFLVYCEISEFKADASNLVYRR